MDFAFIFFLLSVSFSLHLNIVFGGSLLNDSFVVKNANNAQTLSLVTQALGLYMMKMGVDMHLSSFRKFGITLLAVVENEKSATLIQDIFGLECERKNVSFFYKYPGKLDTMAYYEYMARQRDTNTYMYANKAKKPNGLWILGTLDKEGAKALYAAYNASMNQINDLEKDLMEKSKNEEERKKNKQGAFATRYLQTLLLGPRYTIYHYNKFIKDGLADIIYAHYWYGHLISDTKLLKEISKSLQKTHDEVFKYYTVQTALLEEIKHYVKKFTNSTYERALPRLCKLVKDLNK